MEEDKKAPPQGHNYPQEASRPMVRKRKSRDFPGSPVVKTLPFHHGGHRFHPWLGN